MSFRKREIWLWVGLITARGLLCYDVVRTIQLHGMVYAKDFSQSFRDEYMRFFIRESKEPEL